MAALKPLTREDVSAYVSAEKLAQALGEAP